MKPLALEVEEDLLSTEVNLLNHLIFKFIHAYGKGPSDSYEETLLGFIIGYFAGIFALFFIWEPNIVSRNLKQAILAGVSISS